MDWITVLMLFATTDIGMCVIAGLTFCAMVVAATLVELVVRSYED